MIPINQLNPFQTRPPRLFHWRSDGVKAGLQGPGPSFLVLSRAHCRFKCFPETEGQNATQRRAALNLKIRNWSPFPEGAHLTVAAGGRHMVWAWNSGEAAIAVAMSNLKIGRAIFVPETLFQDPMDEGLRLVACLDGYEGQVWSNGALLESRWWSDEPSQADWIAFQRAAGLKPEKMMPTLPRPAKLRWRERPWGGVEASLRDKLKRLEPAEWAVAAGVVVLAPLAFLAFEGLRLSANLSAVEQQIKQLQQSASPIFDAKAQADSAALRIKQLMALDPYPQQITVMARVTSALPEDGTRFVDWSYQNGELSLVLATPSGSLDATSYVRRFQEAGMFSDATVDRTAGPQQLKATMKVLPLAAAKPPSVSEAPTRPPVVAPVLPPPSAPAATPAPTPNNPFVTPPSSPPPPQHLPSSTPSPKPPG